MIDKTIIARYAGIKKRMKELEAEEKAIRDTITALMDDAGSEKEESEYGTLNIYPRVTWKYSPEVQEELEKATQNIQLKAMSNGGAEQVTSKSLRFTLAKS